VSGSSPWITGFDARSWHRLVTLIAPGLSSRPPESYAERAREEGGFLFVLHHEGRVLRALHSLRGAVKVEGWAGPGDLDAVARSHGARFALAAEAGAIEEMYERVGGRVHREDDFWSSALIAIGAARELMGEGRLHLTPALAQGVPLPPVEVVRRAWDYLLPDGRVAVRALFEGVELDTALVVRRRGGGIERLYGPGAIRPMVGPLGGDFRRDYRVIRAAIEREIGSVYAGIYTTTQEFRELLMADAAGSWARAIATRDVVVDPMPPWMAMAAGASALRAAAERSRRLVRGLDALGLLDPLRQRAKELSEKMGEVDLRAVLGFDPLDVVGTILRSSANASRPDHDDEREP
jgi:hypothetical protein